VLYRCVNVYQLLSVGVTGRWFQMQFYWKEV